MASLNPIGGGLASAATRFSLTNTATTLVTGAIRNLSWVLFILGLVHFYYRIKGASGNFIIMFSFFLLGIAFYAVWQKTENDRPAISIPIVLFFVWYFFFKTQIGPYFWSIFVPIIAITLILPSILTKGQALKAEALGLLIVIIYFLDSGFLPWLKEYFLFQPTDLYVNLILYMPWWSLLGLLLLPSGSSKSGFVNALVQITKVVSVFYLVIMFASPFLLPDFTSESLLPTVGELEKSQKEFREQYQGKESPFAVIGYQWSCIWSRSSDIDDCVKEKKEKKIFEDYCKFIEKIDKIKKPTEFKDCVTEQKKKKENQLKIGGASDPTIVKQFKASFKVSDYFPKTIMRKEDDVFKTNYPVEFVIENPRKEKVSVKFSCDFKSKGKDQKTIKGKIKGKQKLTFEKQENIIQAVVCEPEEVLKGKYELNYQAKFTNFKTTSRLNRVFIGKKTLSWKEEWIPKIRSTYFKGSSHLSQSPQDLARLNFAFGASLENPIISDESFLILSSSVQNLGKGDLIKIHHYKINLEGFSPDPGKTDCLEKRNIKVPKLSKSFAASYPLETCIINDYPIELKEPGEFVYKEFTAEIEYDYQVEKKESIEVKVFKE